VVWADGAQTDLGVLAAATAALASCAAGIVAAMQLHGLLRAAAVGVAVLAGAYAAVMIVPVLVVLGGIYLVMGMAAQRPSTAQRISSVVAAALIGGLLGADAYAVGVPGVLTGPILLAAGIMALPMLPTLSARARGRVLGLSSVAAVAALVVSLTIFL
jgi:hypothetical protein